MINSNQINALMAQQAQQQQMLNMGAPMPVVGQSQYPPQFSFGSNPIMGGTLTGGGIGSAAASGVHGLQSAMSVGAMGAGALGIGGSYIGGTAGMLLGLNPLSAALMAGAAGVGAVGNAMNTGVQTNANVGRMLSAANFANPNAPGGFGFGYQDQTRMTRAVLGMGASNAFVGTQDQMRLMDSFQQMGLDKGVTSMGKMIEKFKEFSKTTEDVATQLGKTVSEVTGLVQNLRGSGFYSASDITGMSQRMSASAAYGIGMEQQAQMAQSMGQQARSLGLQRQTGGMLGVNLAQMFGAANQTGLVGEETLLGLTGATNTADASTQLAQSFGSRFGSTLAGGGVMEKLLAGFSKVDASGNISIDERAMAGIASGNMSFDALRSRTGSMAGGQNKALFETNKRRLASEFLQSEQGMGAILGTFRGMASDRAAGGDMTEQQAFTLLMKQYQIADQEESEMLFKMSEDLDGIMNRNTKNKLDTLSAEKRRAFIAKHRSFEGLQAKAGHELEKLYNNPYISERTATASNAFSAGIDALSRDTFGVEDSRLGLYTEGAVDDTISRFITGDLNKLSLGGSETDMFRRGLAARVGDLSQYNEFGDFITGGVSKERLKELGGKLDTSSFEYHTAYANRDKDSLLTNATGFIMGSSPIAEVLGGTSSDGMFNRALQGKSVFAMDDTRDFEDLVAQVKSRGENVTDREAYAVIAQQSPEARAALQRYLGRKGDLAGANLENLQEQKFLSTASGDSGYGFGDAVGFSGMTGAAAGLGLVLAGAQLGSVGGIAGIAVGATIGATVGMMKYGEEKAFQQSMKGGGGNLLGKLSSKKKLKDFDKRYRHAINSNGGDEEAARIQVAKEMSEELGEAISTEDVSGALKALYRSSGEKSFRDRLESDDYGGALKLTKQAGAYQTTQIMKDHLQELRDEISLENVEGIEGLQSALAGPADGMIGRTQEELTSLIQKSIAGEFTYEGDNETLRAIADAGTLSTDLQKLAGSDISALDEAFGEKGIGKKLRKMANVRVHGELSEKELKKMAEQITQSNVLRLQTSEAKHGVAAATAGQSDDEVIKATASLITSTEKLANYVDNIASVLTGNEVTGKKIAGIKAIDKSED